MSVRVWVAVSNAILVFALWLLLFGLQMSPRLFATWINAAFVAVYVQLLAEAALTGGLIESGLSPVLAFIIGLAALSPSVSDRLSGGLGPSARLSSRTSGVML